MSEKVSIIEGAHGRYFSPVDKLKVNNQSSGSSLWVQEDITEVDSLDVLKNGIYYSVNDNLDGYDQVNVNIPDEMDENDIAKGKKITGKEADGNDYAYGKEDEDSDNLSKEKVPSAIHIEIPPTKRHYDEGETIDFSGIHVYLMDGNNHRMTIDDYPTGEIPFDELIFPITIATSDESNPTAETDFNINPNPFTFTHSFVLESHNYVGVRSIIEATGNVALKDASGSFIRIVLGSKSPESIGTLKVTFVRENQDDQVIEWDTSQHASPYTYNGKTVYMFNDLVSKYQDVDSQSLDEIVVGDSSEIAWSMVYGNVTEDDNAIPVQWIRPDGKTLEDTFEITIGEGEDPEPEPDPYEGSYDVESGGHHYNINRSIVPEVHYANGYLWQEGTSEYTVDQAIGFGWLIRLGDM